MPSDQIIVEKMVNLLRQRISDQIFALMILQSVNSLRVNFEHFLSILASENELVELMSHFVNYQVDEITLEIVVFLNNYF